VHLHEKLTIMRNLRAIVNDAKAASDSVTKCKAWKPSSRGHLVYTDACSWMRCRTVRCYVSTLR